MLINELEEVLQSHIINYMDYLHRKTVRHQRRIQLIMHQEVYQDQATRILIYGSIWVPMAQTNNLENVDSGTYCLYLKQHETRKLKNLISYFSGPQQYKYLHNSAVNQL